MNVVIRLSAKEEARALPILLRHSPGTILPMLLEKKQQRRCAMRGSNSLS
jgi:hypothetical protein